MKSETLSFSFAIVFAAGALTAFCDTAVWINTTGTDSGAKWSTAGNWEDGVAPDATDTAMTLDVYMTNDLAIVQRTRADKGLCFNKVVGTRREVIQTLSGDGCVRIRHPESFVGRWQPNFPPLSVGKAGFRLNFQPEVGRTDPYVIPWADLDYRPYFLPPTNQTITLATSVGAGAFVVGRVGTSKEVEMPGTVDLLDSPGPDSRALVRAGTLQLHGAAAVPAVVGDPWLHLDADAAASLTLGEDGATVEEWADVSGNGNKAVRDTGLALAAPKIVKDAESGRTAVSFGAFKGGAQAGTPFAEWTERFGEPAALRLGTAAEGVKELFVVFRDLVRTNSTPYFVGQSDSDASLSDNPFLRGLESAGFFSTDAATLPARTGDISLNGQHRLNETPDDLTRRLQVLSVRLEGGTASFTHLAYGYDALTKNKKTCQGGLVIAELIAYTNVLTTAERRQVNAFLKAKWLVGEESEDWDLGEVSLPSTKSSVSVAAGTVARIRSLRVKSGTLVKEGDGKLYVDRAYDPTLNLVINGGSVEFGKSRPLPSAAMAADPYCTFDASTLEGGASISEWTDPRGRNAAGEEVVVRMDAAGVPATVMANALNGLPVVDFGVVERTLSTSGTASKGNFCVNGVDGKCKTKAREVFVVSAKTDVYGQVLGSSNADFNTANEWRILSDPYGSGIAAAALWEVDGQPIDDPTDFANSVGTYQLLSYRSAEPLTFDAIAVGSRYGGVRVAEVIVYDRRLTEAERTATTRYLLEKWLPEKAAVLTKRLTKVPSITFAEGVTQGCAFGDEVEVVDYPANGDVVKTGPGALNLSDFLPSEGASLAAEGGVLSAHLNIRKGAALSFDATCLDTLEFEVGENGVTNVTKWYDRTYNGRYAEAEIASPLAALPALTNVPMAVTGDLRPVLDFGPYATKPASGLITTGAAAMNWSTWTDQYHATALQEFHIVVADTEADSATHQKIVGTRTTNENTPGCTSAQFERDGQKILSTTTRNGPINEGYIAVDSVETNRTYKTVRNRLTAYTFALTNQTSSGAAFARYGNTGYGGQQVGEAVVFATTNSVERRQAVSDYLTRKWVDPSFVGSYAWTFASLTVANGSRLELVSDVAERYTVPVFGGAGTIALGGAAGGVTTLVLDDGQLSVDGDLSLAEGFSTTVGVRGPGECDRLVVDGTLTLPATAQVALSFVHGATRLTGEFEIMRATALEGAASLAGWSCAELPGGRRVKFRRQGASVYADVRGPGLMLIVK